VASAVSLPLGMALRVLLGVVLLRVLLRVLLGVMLAAHRTRMLLTAFTSMFNHNSYTLHLKKTNLVSSKNTDFKRMELRP